MLREMAEVVLGLVWIGTGFSPHSDILASEASHLQIYVPLEHSEVREFINNISVLNVYLPRYDNMHLVLSREV